MKDFYKTRRQYLINKLRDNILKQNGIKKDTLNEETKKVVQIFSEALFEEKLKSDSTLKRRDGKIILSTILPDGHENKWEKLMTLFILLSSYRLIKDNLHTFCRIFDNENILSDFFIPVEFYGTPYELSQLFDFIDEEILRDGKVSAHSKKNRNIISDVDFCEFFIIPGLESKKPLHILIHKARNEGVGKSRLDNIRKDFNKGLSNLLNSIR